MKTAATKWDAFCFWMSGGDPLALEVHADIAGEEIRVARGYTAVLLGVLTLNFICTGLSVYDVFIDLQPKLTLAGYWVTVVIPIALFGPSSCCASCVFSYRSVMMPMVIGGVACGICLP